jgi:MATE family multidrug resistance protein
MTDAIASAEREPGAARLALPLIAYFFIGNAIGIATLAMVGRLGNAAIAGMGIANVIFGLLLALVFGFDTGVQALASRASGAGARELAGRILTEALVVSTPFGLVLAAICAVYGPRFAALLTPDTAVVDQASTYLMSVAPALAFIAITTPFNAYWIATANPRITFFVTAITIPLEIALTWLFVFGTAGMHGLGVAGAGLAVALGTFVGLLIQLALGMRLKPIEGLFRHRPSIRRVGSILAIGWPVSAQQSLVQAGSIIAFAIISRLGVESVAIFNVLSTLTLVPIQTAAGIGTACGTLVGRALGRGDAAAAKRWGWRLAGAGILFLGPLGLVAFFVPRALLALFLHDPHTLALAVWPTQLLGLGVAIDAVMRILSFALRGAGATKVATLIPFLLQWVLQLPLIYWVGVKLQFGIDGMVAVVVGLSVIEATAFTIVWQRARWARTGLTVMHRRSGVEDSAIAGLNIQRVAVLGGAGAGKSTLSRRIGERLQLPVIHLDRLIYGPRWRKNDVAKVRSDMAAQLGERWVLDGTYTELGDLFFPTVDLVIWIEQPVLLRLWRTWRKTRIHRNAPRADRPDDCEERFTLGYVRTILSFGRFTSDVEKRLRKATQGRVLLLKGDRAVAKFLRALPPGNVVKLAA